MLCDTAARIRNLPLKTYKRLMEFQHSQITCIWPFLASKRVCAFIRLCAFIIIFTVFGLRDGLRTEAFFADIALWFSYIFYSARYAADFTHMIGKSKRLRHT